ncbi:hypothetical protein NA57DRAFT_34864 [Rhizodiscina lignyota]|uniref:Mitochondrial K+-H+ exchange-related-domain-containing protein n=1 Tax=Rhizodiscina lignyota TaxID=1504668 RepID=A0A9P4IHT0_9PEZI|nr:hypothetical protein NA57DRAFT_34864 [Rhizodiscina lignyota]
MRLFLLPISTRRTLIYCERIAQDPNAPRTIADRATSKVNETWISWERKEKGWQKTLTNWGNKVLRQIPFEEWGLKTIPSLTDKRKEMWLSGKSKMEVLYPGLYLESSKVPTILKALATERQALHRRKLYWSLIGLPITAPFALVPVIPNIPFFYLAFRAYSHWKALAGSKHLQFLIENKALRHSPSPALDQAYTAGLMYRTREISRNSPAPTREEAQRVAKLVQEQTNGGSEDVMLLQGWNGKLLAERFKLPEMEVEIERAVEQVEKSIKAKEELMEEKREIERAAEKAKREAKGTIKAK